MRPTDDLRITDARPMIPPAILHEELPVSDEVSETVDKARQSIVEVLHGGDNRLVVVVGPCSVHDPASVFEYASRLAPVAEKLSDKLVMVVRAYFEKPRTTVGWKGYINDPDLNESYHINKGLRAARKLLLDINEMGLPTGSEFLDLQIPQHIADITAWVAIGARTTESQVHRELASGVSMPVGFKNTTEGNVQRAVEAVMAAKQSHWFPSITKQGVSSLFQTRGNEDCHVILRGGTQTGPNFSKEHVQNAVKLLNKHDLPAKVMIDASHGNSNKDHRNQGKVVESICEQLASPDHGIMGVMIESHLVEGRQDISDHMIYGQSVTDACISFEDTVALLEKLASAVR
ncbi:MAG: 3-deoxy-7-phosphoheptulonate synthase [Armatimonadetes bacterium]|nr:3-deoxy-7-phosphoheptulonate synthase [Armatimonadota bacterium]